MTAPRIKLPSIEAVISSRARNNLAKPRNKTYITASVSLLPGPLEGVTRAESMLMKMLKYGSSEIAGVMLQAARLPARQ